MVYPGDGEISSWMNEIAKELMLIFDCSWVVAPNKRVEVEDSKAQSSSYFNNDAVEFVRSAPFTLCQAAVLAAMRVRLV